MDADTQAAPVNTKQLCKLTQIKGKAVIPRSLRNINWNPKVIIMQAQLAQETPRPSTPWTPAGVQTPIRNPTCATITQPMASSMENYVVISSRNAEEANYEIDVENMENVDGGGKQINTNEAPAHSANPLPPNAMAKETAITTNEPAVKKRTRTHADQVVINSGPQTITIPDVRAATPAARKHFNEINNNNNYGEIPQSHQMTNNIQAATDGENSDSDELQELPDTLTNESGNPKKKCRRAKQTKQRVTRLASGASSKRPDYNDENRLALQAILQDDETSSSYSEENHPIEPAANDMTTQPATSARRFVAASTSRQPNTNKNKRQSSCRHSGSSKGKKNHPCPKLEKTTSTKAPPAKIPKATTEVSVQTTSPLLQSGSLMTQARGCTDSICNCPCLALKLQNFIQDFYKMASNFTTKTDMNQLEESLTRKIKIRDALYLNMTEKMEELADNSLRRERLTEREIMESLLNAD